MSKTDVKFESI